MSLWGLREKGAEGVRMQLTKTRPLFKLERLKVDRYRLFPSTNMSATLDFAETTHAGGQALRQLYHTSDRVVIVKYYKTKCSMCRVLQPLMDKVISDFETRIHFVELEVVQNKDVITQVRGLIVYGFVLSERVGGRG